jgi:hypothetical protein
MIRIISLKSKFSPTTKGHQHIELMYGWAVISTANGLSYMMNGIDGRISIRKLAGRSKEELEGRLSALLLTIAFRAGLYPDLDATRKGAFLILYSYWSWFSSLCCKN